MMLPRIYLGTMTFGWSQSSSYVDEGIAKKMMKQFIDFNKKLDGVNNINKIDTARIYAGGKTEKILGSVLKRLVDKEGVSDSTLYVSSKAHPSQPGGLSYDGIKSQFQASLDAMNISLNDKKEGGKSIIDEYYLHQPDTENSLLESLKAAHELVAEGLVSKIGMSNYHACEMERAFDLCEEHNLTKPSVYQGLYNPLNRCVESELLPILKKNKCAFVAYNPLAAGLLTDKHGTTAEGEVKKGRFLNNQNYLPRFYTSINFEALDIIRTACEEEDISMVDATFRWLLCHSALDGENNDGLLIGASSLSHLEENLSACKKSLKSSSSSDVEPLPDSVLSAFDKSWAITQGSAFPYFRSYSSDMPNRENLDGGASYSVKKK